MQYLRIGNSLFVSASDVRIPNGLPENDNSLILASGFPRINTTSALLIRTDGATARVKVTSDGCLKTHWTKQIEGAQSEFYGLIRLIVA